MRANAHDSSFCGRSLEGTRLRTRQRALQSPFGNLRPITSQTIGCPTLAGRGGSVSRRDHNQATGNRVQLTGGTKSEEPYPLNASRSSGEGVWGRGASLREAPLPQNLPNLYDTQRWQVAAALSAAVTTTKQQETASNLQAEPSQKNRTRQTPAALRERGSGGEALLSEKRPLPQNLLTVVFPGGSARGGAFLKKGSLPRIRSLSYNFFAKGLALFGKMGYNKDVSFANVRVLR